MRGEEDVPGGGGEREGYCPNLTMGRGGRRLLSQGGGGERESYDPEKMLLTGQAFSCWVKN